MKEQNDLYGFAYGCPLIKRNENCPFNEIDTLTFKEKVEWIQALNHEELAKILLHHKSCSASRV